MAFLEGRDALLKGREPVLEGEYDREALQDGQKRWEALP